MAKENTGWGYDRIVGALANLGHAVSDQTVGNILRRHGIGPAPKRSRTTSWKDFIGSVLRVGGVKTIILPARSPNLNAFAERWVRSVKDECPSRLILFGERSLARALAEFAAHYHSERNHQGKDNELLFPKPGGKIRHDRITVRRRLGGLLNYYGSAA